MGVSMWNHVCRGNGLWDEVGYMDTLGNRDSQLTSRSALNGFIDNAWVISEGSKNVEGVLAKTGYDSSVCGTYWRGRVVLLGLDVSRWTPLGDLDHGY